MALSNCVYKSGKVYVVFNRNCFPKSKDFIWQFFLRLWASIVRVYLNEAGVEYDENEQRAEEDEETVEQVLVENLVGGRVLEVGLNADWQQFITQLLYVCQQQRHHWYQPPDDDWATGNARVPEIVTSNTISSFLNTHTNLYSAEKGILLVSNHKRFWLRFDKIAYVYFIWKIYLFLYAANN